MLDRNTHFVPCWGDLDRAGKRDLVTSTWVAGMTASKLAQAIARKVSGPAPSRNAIIGVYSRNPELSMSHPFSGRRTTTPWKGKKSVKGQTEKREPRKRKKGKKEAHSTVPVDPTPVLRTEEAQAYDAASRHVPLGQLSARECRWPVNDAEPNEQHLFCGAVTEGMGRYCEHHQKRSRGRPQRRRKKRKRISARLIR